MAQSFKSNLANVAIAYLNELNVPVSKIFLNKHLIENPYYPSLSSLSDTFDKLRIDNKGFKVESEDLVNINPPFATYLLGQPTGKDIVLVTSISEDSIEFISESKTPRKISKQLFLALWQKIIFVAEANEMSGEKDYSKNLTKERAQAKKNYLINIGLGLIIGLLIYQLFYHSNPNNVVSIFLILIIKLLGLSTAILLLIYDVDNSNNVVKNICTLGKKTNCSAVLNSRGSSIFGISWSDAGFFYFGSTFLFLILSILPFGVKIPYLALTSTCISLYIPFSIYYQYKVVKQWCVICLIVQAVLLMELLWSIKFYWISDNIPLDLNLQIILILFTFILIPVVGWLLIKPLVIKTKFEKFYRTAYKRLLYNPKVFDQLLQQQSKAPEGWQTLGIDVGNPNATTTIIKVCNPYCSACDNAHVILEEILEKNHTIKLKIIFTSTNAKDDEGGKVVRHLLALATNKTTLDMQRILEVWYLSKEKNYDLFATKYPLTDEISQESKIDAMTRWWKKAEIIQTPTFFINGKRLPTNYNVNMLKDIF